MSAFFAWAKGIFGSPPQTRQTVAATGPTVPAQTEPDTQLNTQLNSTTGRNRGRIHPLEGHPMTETNRQSALSAATYSTSDSTPVEQIIERADRFFAWLNQDNVEVPVAAATEARTTPARTGEEIIDLIGSLRRELGRGTAQDLIDRAEALRNEPLESAVRTAVDSLDGARDEYSDYVVDLLTGRIQQLVSGTTTEAPTATEAPATGRTGAELIAVVQRYQRNYGGAVDPLMRAAEPLRNAPLEHAKAGYLRTLRDSAEARRYPVQVGALIQEIEAL